jgi:hypothetical protein
MIATSPALRCGNAGLPLARVFFRVCPAKCGELIERHHLAVGEGAQALHVEDDDLPQARRALAHGQDLVELLLVLHEQVLGVAVVDEILELRRRIRGIDTGGDPGGAQHAQIAEQPLLVVLRQDGGALSRLQPERDEARADDLRRLAVLPPRVSLPDAAVLLAHGDLVGLGGHPMPEQGPAPWCGRRAQSAELPMCP